jgi:predicted ferric reductase
MLVVVAGNIVLIIAMWLRHGGLEQVGTLSGAATAAGQLTALLGTFAALLELVLLSRTPWLEQRVGTDRLVGWHRWVGFACLWLISAHLVFTTIGWGATAGRGVIDEFVSLLADEAYVFMAAVGFVAFLAVGLSSMRWVRNRLSYETWYGLHLYAYVGIALAFLHALFVGTDFLADPVASGYWLALYALAFGLILVFRVGAPIMLNLRHRLVVAHVVPEAAGVVSIYIAGRDLGSLHARAGQFFQWRFLTGGGWWRAHPYSLSAVPDGHYLRITVKGQGVDSKLAQHLRPGVRVFAEGPYGAFTADRLTRDAALFIAGGIGITPLRAMLDELPRDLGSAVLVYRASSWQDVAFRAELDAMAAQRRVQVIYLVGRRSDPAIHGEPLSPEAIAAMVPDIGERDVFVSGSDGFITHVRSSLRKLGLRGDHVHAERFAF